MSGKALLDSNIIIYWTKGLMPNMDWLQQFDVVAVSVITYMEVLGFPFSNTQEKMAIEKFFSAIEILPINDMIVEKVIAIKQKQRIKLPDAIIAATVIIENCTLITRNTSDFQVLLKESIVNPFE